MIKDILKEFNLELDDVRWYLASGITESLLFYKNKKHEITNIIWSGKLEAELYNMEEIFLEKLEDEYRRDIKDEASIREIFNEIYKLKKERFK